MIWNKESCLQWNWSESESLLLKQEQKFANGLKKTTFMK